MRASSAQQRLIFSDAVDTPAPLNNDNRWNQKLGVWTGWGAPALAERVEGESMYFKVGSWP